MIAPRFGIALVLAALLGPSLAAAQNRPQAGSGAIFTAPAAGVFGYFADLEGSFVRAEMPGNAGDFARITPNGDHYFTIQDGRATLFVQLASGETFRGTGSWSCSFFGACTDLGLPTWSCTTEGGKKATFNVHGIVASERSGRPYRLRGHLMLNSGARAPHADRQARIEVTPL